MKVSFSTYSYNQRNDSALILCRTKEAMSDDNVFCVLSARSPSMLDSSAPSFQIELPQDINDLASPPVPIPRLQTSLSSSSSFSARHEFASSNSLGLLLSTSSSVSRSTLASAPSPSSQHTLLSFKSVFTSTRAVVARRPF